jgi:hypothetical protein
MDNIIVDIDELKLKKLLIRERANFSLNYEENKEIFKEWFIKKYEKRIVARTRIRKKLTASGKKYINRAAN